MSVSSPHWLPQVRLASLGTRKGLMVDREPLSLLTPGLQQTLITVNYREKMNHEWERPLSLGFSLSVSLDFGVLGVTNLLSD